ncbi:MAG: hypothetical protein ACLUW6_08880 [Coriobacteriaceae bacterium]
MIPLEEARALVCGAVEKLPVETVELLDAVGRVVAADQTSDIDVSPFAHSAMDGFALRAAEIADAAEESPAMLRVIAGLGARHVQETLGEGECIAHHDRRLPACRRRCRGENEIRGVVEGDGKPGSVVSFSAPTKVGSTLRCREAMRGRGRGGAMCSRRRRQLSGGWRAGGARLPPTARDRHCHGQRARAALRGARPR